MVGRSSMKMDRIYVCGWRDENDSRVTVFGGVIGHGTICSAYTTIIVYNVGLSRGPVRPPL